MAGLEAVDGLIELRRLEDVVQRGLKAFAESGAALSEIRDRRLYKLTHTSFDAYCLDVWGFCRKRAEQLIGASAVMDALPQTGVRPSNEAQTRPLAGLPPAQQQQVWASAVKDSGGAVPTMAVVANAVAQSVAASKPPVQVAPTPSKPSPIEIGALVVVVADDALVPAGTDMRVAGVDRAGHRFELVAMDGKTCHCFRGEIELRLPPTLALLYEVLHCCPGLESGLKRRIAMAIE